MAVTGQLLINKILWLLNEQSQSIAPQFASNVAASPTYSTNQGLIYIANDFIGRLCRTCYAWEDYGTMAYTPGARFQPLTGISTASGGTIWRAHSCAWNGADLYSTDESHVRINYPSLQSSPGTPQFFYANGQYDLGLAPLPGTSASVTVWGYAVPPLLTSANLSVNLNWIDDDCMVYIAYGAAAELARQNSEDLLLQGKVAEWEAEAINAHYILYGKLDSNIARAYFTTPPPRPQVESNLSS